MTTVLRAGVSSLAGLFGLWLLALPPAMVDGKTDPVPPIRLESRVIDSRRVELRWLDRAPLGTQYLLQFKAFGNAEWGFMGKSYDTAEYYRNGWRVAVVDALQPAVEFSFRVIRRYPREGRGTNVSNESVVKTKAAAPPQAPTELRASLVGPGLLRFRWRDNAGNEDGFRIERKVNGEPVFIGIGKVDRNASEFQCQTGVSPAAASYRVIAFNADGRSPASNVIAPQTAAAAARQFHEAAAPWRASKGGPKDSDVFFVGKSGKEHEEAANAAVARAFLAQRVVGVRRSPTYAARVVPYSMSMGNALSQAETDGWCLRNKNGDKILFRDIGEDEKDCLNDPRRRYVYMEIARSRIAMGASEILQENPGGNYSYVDRGACWCPYCRHRASMLGVNLESPEEMKGFQWLTTLEFSESLHVQIRQAAQGLGLGAFPIACDAGARLWRDPELGPILADYDYAMGVLPESEMRPSSLLKFANDMREYGRGRVWKVSSRDKARVRATIAAAYAMKMPVVVPQNATGLEIAQDYADLYGFVRAVSQRWAGYEDATSSGYDLPPDPRFVMGDPIEIRGGSGKLMAHVKAVPQNSSAPVIVHFVEWGASKGAEVRLRLDAMVVESPPRITLWRPVPYSRERHKKAESTKDYSHLAEAVNIPVRQEGGWLVMDIPPLSPWGFVEIAGQKIDTRRAS